ncbi:MAG: bifunctional diaminohydroxyphosphoribosylaminopyrimidine deaminase/5-amino-6-(5-phosphoribosylamino)uracil reductase RibD [Candidatus Coatesbacteria bacterium]|nr:bifunctional diaminohydroxyphosphoribosylaminopyrimidine deaminase/5-amino-6-(5-phosphoribosylamino)uracil reductase RibD [Candidatus Coatesbacteria bacterium]
MKDERHSTFNFRLSTFDFQFMNEALRLAGRARGKTSPNPMVGAILVKNGRKVASGYHRRAGEPHAEVLAIERAGSDAKDSTLYVNLEPCSHYGRTPPCADLIVNARIKRVVVGAVDPNPLVAGKGIALLRQAGIQIDVGVLEDRCKLLNEVYFKFIATGLPFVTLKLAQTLDGKIATKSGDSKWITGEKARRFAHKLRSESDAVLVGRGAVEKDDPQLTVRLVRPARKDRPVRVILDSGLRTSPDAKVFSSGARETIVAATEAAPLEREKALRQAGASIIRTGSRDGRVNIEALLRALAQRELSSVLVEGGAEVAWEFVSQGLFDKLVLFVAPKILGGRESIPSVSGLGFAAIADAIELSIRQIRRLGSDLVIVAYPTARE